MDRDDEFLQAIERESRARTERLKSILRERGRDDLADELDAKLREIRLGVTGAQTTWHSVSAAQRRVLLVLSDGNRKLVRTRHSTVYDACGGAHDVSHVARLPTVRNLATRELLAWEGGAFDPERVAV